MEMKTATTFGSTLEQRVKQDKKLNMSTGGSIGWSSSGLKNFNDYGTNKN